MIYSPNLSLNLNKKSGQTVLELRFVTKKNDIFLVFFI